jgi:hypothetical protein
MAVRAYMALVLPSTFVLSTRRMCWKLGETTNDIFSEIDKEVKEPLNVEPVVFNKMFGNTNIIGGKNLLVLLSTQPSVSISHFDGQLGSTLNNDFPKNN